MSGSEAKGLREQVYFVPRPGCLLELFDADDTSRSLFLSFPVFDDQVTWVAEPSHLLLHARFLRICEGSQQAPLPEVVELVAFLLRLIGERIRVRESAHCRLGGAHACQGAEPYQVCAPYGLRPSVSPIAFGGAELFSLFFGYGEVHLCTDGSLVSVGSIDFDLFDLVVGITPYCVSEKDYALLAGSYG